MQETLMQSFRLSPLQKRAYLLQHETTHFPLYTCCSLHITGPLHIARLRAALQMLTDRYEILRTTFQPLPGLSLPAQVIADKAKPAFFVHNLTSLTHPQQAAALTTIEQEKRFYQEALNREPVLQATLLVLAEQTYQLLLHLPTLNADSTSYDILLHDLAAIYAADDAPLDEPLQYADLAEWQHELLAAIEMEEGRAYWQTLLTDKAPAKATLPTDKTRQASATFTIDTLPLRLPDELAIRLTHLASRRECPLKALLLTGWLLVLEALCQQDQLLLGIAYDGRNYADLKQAVGILTRYLPFLCPLYGELSCREALQHVQRKLEETQQWQESFYWENFGDTHKHPSGALYTFGFTYEEGVSTIDIGALQLTLERKDTYLERFNAELFCRRNDQGIQAILTYDSSLYQSQYMHWLLERWQLVLEQLVAPEERLVKNLNLLTGEEYQLLVQTWNATEKEYPHLQSVTTLITAQVERTPDRIAVIATDMQVTFHTLDTLTNRLACYLQQHGVGPEICVGLYIERSLEMLIGILGVLKAGGIYVPLDPSHPQQRVAFMLQDTSSRFLLTQHRLLEHIPATTAQILCLDNDWQQWAQEKGKRPARGADCENIAYIIYTSGSTGQPKGVAVTHRGLVNYLCWASTAYAVENGDGSLVHSPLTFDLTITALFLPLLAGLAVRLLPEEAQITELGEAFAQSNHLSLVKLTPAHLDLLANLLPAQMLSGKTNVLVIGGEALYSETLRAWQNATPETRLINEYGPTETVVGCCTYEVAPDRHREGPIPIGRPIANTRLYVLDRELQLVPIGMSGELYIGGAGIARGYLHRPDLTALQFIPDPFSTSAGERLYKTGDSVHYEMNGTLVYLGRLDHQIKIRGYRIELAEIEAVLKRNPEIGDAVVVAHEFAKGEKSLVAYVVGSKDTTSLAPDTLRAYLRGQLPDYMVPTFFVVLAALPLTAHGKVNRGALPPPDKQPTSNNLSTGQIPHTTLEELLIEMWKDILEHPQISTDANFFELGGHSLLATRLVARVQEVLQVEVSLRAFFKEPTVSALAQEIQRIRHNGEFHAPPPITVVSRDQKLPLSFAQQRLWFLEQLEPGSLIYLISIAYSIHETLHSRLLERSLTLLIQRHESLRTTFQIDANLPIQVIHPPTNFRLPIIDLQGLDTEAREQAALRLIRQEGHQSCDLTHGPLLRVNLVLVHSNEQVLLLTIHHIITDGWSQEILFRELLTYYHGFVTGTAATLPSLPIHYADFALWQRQWLQEQAFETLVTYWKQQLTNAAMLELPTDRPRPARQTSHGTSLPVRLTHTLQAQLNELSRHEGTTLFMTLLASFHVLLARYSGQTDISVGTPIANRTRTELEGLIGFFVNTLVLRIDLSDSPTTLDMLKRVRNVALEAYDYQDIPFEYLVEILQKERDLSRNPLFQVMFILQNTPRASLQDLAIHATPLASNQTIAKFDLTLSLAETDQGLRGQIDYNVDLYEESTIERMIAHWQILLEGMVTHPTQDVFSLPLLTSAEMHQYVQQRNASGQHDTDERDILQRIMWHVEHIPDALAVNCDDACLSYHELERQTNVVAQYLYANGAGPEVPVALMADRDIPFLIGLLAVFKVGAVYLPLDPLFPLARLNVMLHQSHCLLVITTSSYLSVLQQALAEFPQEHPPRVIPLEPLLRKKESADKLQITCAPLNLAYMIYTSGSTGTPKGVMVEHKGMLNHLLAKITDVQLTGADILAQNGPQCFDISLWQCLAPLMVGGKVHIFRDEIAFHPGHLAQQIEEKAISVVQLVPSLLRDIIHTIHSAAAATPLFSTLRWIVPTGDALPAELCHQWLALYPHIPLLNTYGSTECSDDQCHYPIIHTAEIGETPIVTIGTPIPHMRAYVLDKHLELVPTGVIGELYIGGTGVGRGYLDDAERTAMAFLPDVFAADKGARFYKTGDRARYQANGTIEFLGRVDHLVKIRGYRIELGEIEAALSSHPQLRAVVVVTQQASNGLQHLVAYVVSDAIQPVPSNLQRYLQGKLPDYMIPKHFVVLDALPLTTNGKINRRALPLPDFTNVEQAHFVAPRTPAEKIVAAIWEDVLQVPQIGMLDNFFVAGGHSLLAAQVVSRLCTTFQIDMPLRTLFEAPTIEALVNAMAHIHGNQETLTEIALILLEIEQMTTEQVEKQLFDEEKIEKR